MLQFGATVSPRQACIVAGDHVHTFAESSMRASRLAAAFRRNGIRRGDRVSLLAQNEIEYTEIQVAAIRAGVILAPLNWSTTTARRGFPTARSSAIPT